MHGESWGGAAPLQDSAIHIMSRARPGAWRATVNGMLPDFRFAFGAMLAIAVLAVTGLALATSVQLMHAARMDPIEDARSLAFAGHPEWNQSSDPAGAQRFGGLADNPAVPLAEARLDAAAESPPISSAASEQPGSGERTTSSIGQQPEPDTVADNAPVTTEPKAPETETTPAPLGEAAARTPDDPGTTGSVGPMAEQVANAPAALPETQTQTETRLATQTPAPATPQAAADPPQNSLPPPQAAADPPPDSSPPTPRARPKAHLQRRVARLRRRSTLPPIPQPVQNSGWPASNPPSSSQSWPGYDNQFSGTTAKKTGKLSATPPARPQ